MSGARALRRPGRVDKLDLAHDAVDTLVNNAGIYLSAAIEEMTSAEWAEVFAVNADARSCVSKPRHGRCPTVEGRDRECRVALGPFVLLFGKVATAAAQRLSSR